MKLAVVYNSPGLRYRLATINRELKQAGYTQECPAWFDHREITKISGSATLECNVCHTLFPKSYPDCPCHAKYSIAYLRSQVRKILSQLKKAEDTKLVRIIL